MSLLSHDDGVSWLGVDDNLLGGKHLLVAKLTGETLHDELLGDHEVFLRAQLQELLLGEMGEPNALDQCLLLSISELGSLSECLDLVVLLCLEDIEHMLDLVLILLFKVDLGLCLKLLHLLLLLGLHLLLKVVLSCLLLLFCELGPYLWWGCLLSCCERLCVWLDGISDLDILSDNINEDLLMSDVETVTAQNLHEVVKVQQVEELNVLVVRVSHDLVEVVDDDVQGSLHDLGVVVLQGI